MRRILYLTTILIAQTLMGSAQTNESKNEKITADFFYGTWSLDSSKTTTWTFTKEREAFIKVKGGGMEPYEHTTTVTYKLTLDKKPETIELKCKKDCSSAFPKKAVLQIEVINSTQVLLVFVDKTGNIERARLTKNE